MKWIAFFLLSLVIHNSVLQAQNKQSYTPIILHGEAIFSDDEKYIISQDFDNPENGGYVWDLKTGKVLNKYLNDKDSFIRRNTLYSIDQNPKKFFLKEKLDSLLTNKQRYDAAEISNNSQCIAIKYWDKLSIYNFNTSKEILKLKSNSVRTKFHFSITGKYLLVTDEYWGDFHVHNLKFILFNTETFKVEYKIKGIHPTVQAEFSPKHHHIINRNSSEVNLLEVSKDKIKGCSFNNDFNNCSAISYDDKLIAIVGNYYDTCTVKQISTGKTVSEIIFEDGYSKKLHFDAKSKYIMYKLPMGSAASGGAHWQCNQSLSINFFNLKSKKNKSFYCNCISSEGFDKHFRKMYFYHEGHNADNDKSYSAIIGLEKNDTIFKTDIPVEWLEPNCITNNYSLAMTNHGRESSYYWNSKKNSVMHFKDTTCKDSLHGSGMSGEQNEFIYSIKIWDIKTQQLKYILKGNLSPIYFSRFNKKGTILITVSKPEVLINGKFILRKNKVMIWDMQKGSLVKSFAIDSSATIGDVWFEKNLLLTYDNNGIQMYNLEEGRKLFSLYSFDKDDYVIIDEQGMFDGTKEGLSKIYCNHNGKLTSLEDMKETYYYPNLIKKFL